MHPLFVARRALLVSAAASTLLPALIAQQVSMGLVALTPLVAQVDTSGTITTDSLPAGPMPANGQLQATGASLSGAAIIDWFQDFGPDRHELFFTSQILTPAGSVATPTAGPFEVLIELSATAPTPVRIEFEADTLLTNGMPAPLIAIDEDNDGLVEHPDLTLSGGASLLQVTLDTQPKLLRLMMASQHGPQLNGGQSIALLRLAVRPQNLVALTRTATSCAPVFDLDLRPVFADRGVDAFLGPQLYVLGLNAQPTLLLPQAPLPMLTTCLLMPSPDLLVFDPLGKLHVPLPAALRPVALHLQGVRISGNWTLSDAYRIDAY